MARPNPYSGDIPTIEVSVLTFRLSVEDLRKGFRWLAWAVVVLAAINLVIVLAAVREARPRTVLVVADAFTFALAIGTLLLLRRRASGPPPHSGDAR